MSEEFNVFNGTVDRYNGITIDTETEAVGDQFADKLKSMFLQLGKLHAHSKRLYK